MISGVKTARFGIENVGEPETVTIRHRHSSNEQCSPLSFCWLGPCIGNFQPGQLGSRHYNTVDVNKQLVHAREKQLCGCITRFSTLLWRPPHDYDVKLPNHFTGDIKTEFFYPSLTWARFLRINKLLANCAGLKSFKNREMRHRVYDKRETWICTSWPCFPFTYR